MLNQQTLRQPVSFSGIGLHSGNKVNMTFLPAEVNTGIRFRRVDLEGSPEIEARIDSVVETQRSTTLGKGNLRIHTVEHVLSTMSGMGIDNSIVEIDSNEPPVGDGSARPYAKMIKEAGLMAQPEPRDFFQVRTPLELQVGETTMTVFPHDRLKVSCVSSDRGGRFTQYYSLEITPESWEKELAHARTFCFLEEIEALIKNGLIRGGSLENAVVIRDDAVLTTEPLRYPEEFVRHKMLDIVGDLALLGRPVCGHIMAIRPSHAANCALARQLDKQVRKPLESMQMFTPSPASLHPLSNQAPIEIPDGGSLDIVPLMRVLPHRYPFLMVDRVTKIDGNRITAIKNVSINEPYFQGHYPGHPIMPGVLQLEAIAQVAGVLMMRQPENLEKLAFFMSAEEVKWRRPVRPGDTLVIEVELTKNRGKIGKAQGFCRVEGEVVSEAQVTFMMGDKRQ